MTVAELIKVLEQYPSDANVGVERNYSLATPDPDFHRATDARRPLYLPEGEEWLVL